jgi:hypothetical protein
VQLGLQVAMSCGVMTRSASSGMSRWRSRKVVSMVCAGRGGFVGCRGDGPESLAVLRTMTSCHVGDKVDFAQLFWRFVFFTYVGVSRVCSSHSSTSSLRLGYEVG